MSSLVSTLLTKCFEILTTQIGEFEKKPAHSLFPLSLDVPSTNQVKKGVCSSLIQICQMKQSNITLYINSKASSTKFTSAQASLWITSIPS